MAGITFSKTPFDSNTPLKMGDAQVQLPENKVNVLYKCINVWHV